MFTRKNLFAALLIVALFVSACSSPTSTPAPMADKPTEAVMMDKPTETAMMEKPTEAAMMDKPTEAAMMDKPTESAMMDTPTWFKASFTDARTGETFSVADFKGKVVLVETLAQWCSNCLKQQKQVLELHKLLGERDDFVSLGIDIDVNENAADLKTYVEGHGFDWLYTVAAPEVAREIGQLYGDQFLNPPSTPMFIIDREGKVHPLPFGIKSADDLFKALEPFLKAGM